MSVVQLRRDGFNFEEIAEIVGLGSVEEVKAEFERGMAKVIKEDPNSQSRMRDLAGIRLERMLRAVWAQALDPTHPNQMVAFQRALSVIQEHNKLFGLNAATRLDVSVSPAHQEIEAFVKAIHSVETMPEQDNILDAEWTEELEEGA